MSFFKKCVLVCIILVVILVSYKIKNNSSLTDETNKAKNNEFEKYINVYVYQENLIGESSRPLEQVARRFEKEKGVGVNFVLVEADFQAVKELIKNEDTSVDVVAYTGTGLTENEMILYLEPLMLLSDANLYYDSGLLSSLDKGGHSIYVQPTSIEYKNGVIYNKTTLEKNGIDKLPSNISELTGVMKTLKDKGVTPLALMESEKWTLSIITKFSDYVSGKSNAISQLLNYETPLSSESDVSFMLRQFAEYKRQGYTEINTSFTFDTAMQNLQDGKLGMMFGDSFIAEEIDRKSDDEIVFDAPIDYGNGRYITAEASDFWGVSKYSENKKESKEFIKFLNQDTKYLEDINMISANIMIETIVPDRYKLIYKKVIDGDIEVIYNGVHDENFYKTQRILLNADLYENNKLYYDALHCVKYGQRDLKNFDEVNKHNDELFTKSKEDLGY